MFSDARDRKRDARFFLIWFGGGVVTQKKVSSVRFFRRARSLELREVNSMERQFLAGLGYDLYIQPKKYSACLFEVLSIVVEEAPTAPRQTAATNARYKPQKPTRRGVALREDTTTTRMNKKRERKMDALGNRTLEK